MEFESIPSMQTFYECHPDLFDRKVSCRCVLNAPFNGNASSQRILRPQICFFLSPVVENPDDSVAQDENTESDQPNPDEEQRPVRKKKRPNRMVSTVTKNKDTINAKLETTTETDAIFAKLNSTVENNNSAKKLLQYVLSSQSSELRLRMNYKLWKCNDAPINDLNGTDVYDDPVIELPEINWIPCSTDQLRQQLAGYLISNTPAEDDG